MLGIGTDIVEIDRFKNNHQEISTKILCFDELDLYNSFGSNDRKMEFIAGRWAAKEAITKALDHTPKFVEIEITTGDNQLKVTYKNYQLKLSISHSKSNAIAFCIWEK